MMMLTMTTFLRLFRVLKNETIPFILVCLIYFLKIFNDEPAGNYV